MGPISSINQRNGEAILAELMPGALVAGAVFTIYAKRTELAERSTRFILEYIEEKNDAKLWAACKKGS